MELNKSRRLANETSLLYGLFSLRCRRSGLSGRQERPIKAVTMEDMMGVRE